MAFTPTPLPPPSKRRRLGEILRDAGVIDEAQLASALAGQRKWGGKLGRTLIEMGMVDEDSMLRALSRQLAMPLADLAVVETIKDLPKLLRVDTAERYGVIPLGADRRHNCLHVATSDPTNVEALQELAFTTGMRIQTSLASATAIERAIRRHYHGEESAPVAAATTHTQSIREATFEVERLGEDRTAASARSAPAQANTELETLRHLVAQQSNALRALIDLMMEKGTFNRDEYVATLRARSAKG